MASFGDAMSPLEHGRGVSSTPVEPCSRRTLHQPTQPCYVEGLVLTGQPAGVLAIAELGGGPGGPMASRHSPTPPNERCSARPFGPAPACGPTHSAAPEDPGRSWLVAVAGPPGPGRYSLRLRVAQQALRLRLRDSRLAPRVRALLRRPSLRSGRPHRPSPLALLAAPGGPSGVSVQSPC